MDSENFPIEFNTVSIDTGWRFRSGRAAGS